METSEGGAYAACGVFLPSFLEKLTRADKELSKSTKTKLMRFLREIGKGARQILKIHRDICTVESRVELHQTSIKNFLVKKPGKEKDNDSDTSGGSDAKLKSNEE